MVKNLFLCFMILSFSGLTISCKNDEPEIEIPDDDPGNVTPDTPDTPETPAKDLSIDGLANCYIVQESGIYKFKADNMFNQGEGLPVPPEISPASAGLIWQTVKSSITSVELINEDNAPYVKFNVAQAKGNAVLAVYNSKGEIEWSWHIWMPEEEVKGIATTTGYEVMNMNLGAMNNKAGDAESYGMLYQWGRKDPFPAAATLTGDLTTVSAPMYNITNGSVEISNSSWYDDTNNTLAYSISHPTVCLSNYSRYTTDRDWLKDSDDTLWGNPKGYVRDSSLNTYPNKGTKTCYDPSPAGWRVAPADAFRNFTSSGGYEWTFSEFNIADYNNDGILNINDYDYGWWFNVNNDTSLYFPAAARFDGSYAMLMGSVSGIWGSYWSNSPAGSDSVKGRALSNLSFQVKDQNGGDMITISPSGTASRADAYSIRCIKDI